VIAANVRIALDAIRSYPVADETRVALRAVSAMLHDDLLDRIERVARGHLGGPPEQGLEVVIGGIATTAEVMLLGRIAALKVLPTLTPDQAFDHLAALAHEIEALEAGNPEPFQDRLRIHLSERLEHFDIAVAKGWAAGTHAAPHVAPRVVSTHLN
jgi:hypothetical protein